MQCPPKPVSEGIDAVLSSSASYCIWPERFHFQLVPAAVVFLFFRRALGFFRFGFLFPLADRFAAFVDDFTLLFVLNDADRRTWFKSDGDTNSECLGPSAFSMASMIAAPGLKLYT